MALEDKLYSAEQLDVAALGSGTPAIAINMISPCAWVSVDALTAHAGGGQANATKIDGSVQQARVSIVASAADSIVLPPSYVGAEIAIMNDASANAMNVFPAVGESINLLSANTALSVAIQTVTIFYCFAIGKWKTK